MTSLRYFTHAGRVPGSVRALYVLAERKLRMKLGIAELLVGSWQPDERRQSQPVCAVTDVDTGGQRKLAAASAAQFPLPVVSVLAGAPGGSRGRGRGRVVR